MVSEAEEDTMTGSQASLIPFLVGEGMELRSSLLGWGVGADSSMGASSSETQEVQTHFVVENTTE